MNTGRNRGAAELQRRHERTWSLLPWYCNGTLEGDEQKLVLGHLNTCLVCRQELARLRREVALVGEYDPVDTPAEHAFDNLMRHIRSGPQSRTGVFIARLRSWLAPAARPAWAVPSVLAAVLGAGVYLYAGDGPPARYRTLAEAPPAVPAPERPLRAVFDGALSLNAFHAILSECGVTIEAGPNSAGAYTLRAGAGRHSSALACLRNRDTVRFAAPAVAGGGGDR